MRAFRHPTFAAAAVCWLPFVLLGAALAAVPLVPAGLRWRDYHALPPWPTLAALAAFGGAAAATARCRARAPVHALLVALLLVLHLVTTVQPLGDGATWRAWAKGDQLGASELLANALHHLTYVAFGPDGLDLVAPAVGALAAWTFLGFVERVFARDAGPRAPAVRRLGAAVLALSGWQLLGCRGFVENTLPSVPCLLAGLDRLVHYGRTGDERALGRAACWLALASLCHGVMTAMLPTLGLVALWRAHGQGALAGAWRPLGIALGAALGTAALVVGALLAAGFVLAPGHVGGGGDGTHFVPWSLAGAEHHYDFALFDLAHAADVGNTLLATSPLALAAAGLLVSSRWRTALRASVAGQPVLAIAGLGALVFTSVYYFDLRFPRDFDLMMVMSLPAGLLLLQAAARAPRAVSGWLWFALLANGAATWTLFAALLVPPAADAPGVLLAINRRVGVVALRPGETVTLHVRPPADGTPPFTFAVFAHRGEPAAGEGRGGLAFAAPGTPGADPLRTFVVLDPTTVGVAGYLAPPLTEPWTSQPLGNTATLGPLVVQGLLRDAHGQATATNVVRLVPR